MNYLYVIEIVWNGIPGRTNVKCVGQTPCTRCFNSVEAPTGCQFRMGSFNTNKILGIVPKREFSVPKWQKCSQNGTSWPHFRVAPNLAQPSIETKMEFGHRVQYRHQIWKRTNVLAWPAFSTANFVTAGVFWIWPQNFYLHVLSHCAV